MRIRPLIWFTLITVLLVLALGGCSRDTAPPTNADADTAPATETADTTAPADTTTSSDTATVGTDVVAYVNDVAIDTGMLDRAKQQVLSRYQQIYSQFGMDVYSLLSGAQGRVFQLRIEDEALELATTRTLIRDELNRRDAQISDEEVDTEFRRQYDEFLSVLGMTDEEFQEAFASGEMAGLQTGDLTFDEFIAYAKQTVREDLEVQALQRLVAGPIEPTAEELQTYFGENQSNYDVQEQVSASHILVATREQAEQLLTELQDGADFATLAKENSLDTTSGAQGGALGWFSRGDMVEAFDEAAFSTPVGELSDIVETQYGFHIILVTDHRDAKSPTYDEVADDVFSDYEADIRSQRFSTWYSSIRPLAQISVVDPMLNAYRIQGEDTEKGLQEFIRLRDENLVDEPYLEYIIGTIYESLMEEARSQKQEIENSDTITADQQAQIDALDVKIESLRLQTLEAYRAAVESLGGDDQIEAQIEILDPPADSGVQTDSQETTDSGSE
jgi:parvulin-like peptidyl-prolyl isomerase